MSHSAPSTREGSQESLALTRRPAAPAVQWQTLNLPSAHRPAQPGGMPAHLVRKSTDVDMLENVVVNDPASWSEPKAPSDWARRFRTWSGNSVDVPSFDAALRDAKPVYLKPARATAAKTNFSPMYQLRMLLKQSIRRGTSATAAPASPNHCEEEPPPPRTRPATQYAEDDFDEDRSMFCSTTDATWPADDSEVAALPPAWRSTLFDDEDDENNNGGKTSQDSSADHAVDGPIHGALRRPDSSVELLAQSPAVWSPSVASLGAKARLEFTQSLLMSQEDRQPSPQLVTPVPEQDEDEHDDEKDQDEHSIEQAGLIAPGGGRQLLRPFARAGSPSPLSPRLAFTQSLLMSEEPSMSPAAPASPATTASAPPSDALGTPTFNDSRMAFTHSLLMDQEYEPVPIGTQRTRLSTLTASLSSNGTLASLSATSSGSLDGSDNASASGAVIDDDNDDQLFGWDAPPQQLFGWTTPPGDQRQSLFGWDRLAQTRAAEPTGSVAESPDLDDSRGRSMPRSRPRVHDLLFTNSLLVDDDLDSVV